MSRINLGEIGAQKALGNQTVFSPHAFRGHASESPMLPLIPPPGKSFVLVTHPTARDRRYFHSHVRSVKEFEQPKINLSIVSSMAKKFNHLRMAECWAEWLHMMSREDPTLPDFFIVLEES